MKDRIFNYQGNAITFESGDGSVMVNATQMAKPFGKSPKDFLKTESTQEFLQMLDYQQRDKNPIGDYQLVIIKKGGAYDQGTWFHEDVALEFARWLSPAFAIWCNAKIKELLTRGATAIGSMEEDRKILEVIELLKSRVSLQTQELEKQAPKVEYHDTVLQSHSTYTANQIAKEMGMSAVTLNKKLYEKKVQYKQGETWLLYHTYQDKGYAKTKTHVFTDSEGKTKTRMTTVWTEKGRYFIHRKLKKNYAEA